MAPIWTPQTNAELHRLLRRSGLVLIGVYCALMPLSFGIAAVSPFNIRQVEEIAALKAFVSAGWIPSRPVVEFLDRYVSGDSILALTWVRTGICVALLAVATLAALYATLLLARSERQVVPSTVTLLWRIALVIGAVNVAIYPMFTQDFWLSVVWGRMLASGHNPYYEYFTAAALSGTPLLDFPILMTYGPLWAWVSAAAVLASGSSVVLMFVSAKLVLFGCWAMALYLIRAILADAPLVHQAGALCCFGWWPMSAHFAVGEGHNDVASVCLVLLWIHMTTRKSHAWSLLPLIGSVLIKYLSAPLLLIAAWEGLVRDKRGRGMWVLAAICSGILAVGATIPLWRDRHFFDPLVSLGRWQFLAPAGAGSTVLQWIGLPAARGLTTMAVVMVFAAFVLYYGMQFVRASSRHNLIQIVLAVSCAIMFASLGHVWPWFLISVLAPAALAGSGPLWRFVVAAVLIAPFLDVLWLAADGWQALPVTGVVFFGTTCVVAASPLAWRRLEWGRNRAPGSN